MISQTSELEVILQRLEKLERENRRLKRAGSLVLLVVAVGFLMAQGRYSRRIEAEEFVVTDAHGNERAALAWQDKAPRLVLLDREGAPAPVPYTAVPASNFGGAPPAIGSEVAPRNLSPASPRPPSVAQREVAASSPTRRVPRAPELPLVASLAEPAFDASALDWDADAAALPAPASAGQDTVQAGKTSPSDAHAPSGSPQVGADPLDSLPVQSVLRSLRDPQSRPAGSTTPQVAGPLLAQVERPFDAGSAWPPTSVAAAPPAVDPSAIEAGPEVPPPSATLKVLGYADNPDKGREIFISEESEVFVVREGEIFAERFRVLRITPTEVEIEDELRRERFSVTFQP